MIILYKCLFEFFGQRMNMFIRLKVQLFADFLIVLGVITTTLWVLIIYVTPDRCQTADYGTYKDNNDIIIIYKY